MILTRLFVYPVKSLAGIELTEAVVDDFGVTHDRRWLVVDEQNVALTQRDFPRMVFIRPTLTERGIRLEAPEMPGLSVETPAAGPLQAVNVWDDTVDTTDAGTEVSQWLSDYLNSHVRLTYMPDQTFRRVDPTYSPDPRRVSFADAFPFLLISQESMDELNRRLETPMGIERFRPNIVVQGADSPHAEDDWRQIRIGEIEFALVKPCARCAVPTIDPVTAEKGKEPTRTLSSYRKRNGKVYFGQNVIHGGTGTLRVNAPVDLLA
jgi:uncharacterized protein YcbX